MRQTTSQQEGKKLPVPHCIRGTEGWEIIDQLREDARHPIDKPAFASRYLGALLKARDEDLHKQGKPGVEKVTFIGLCTDICVISNALLIKRFCRRRRLWWTRGAVPAYAGEPPKRSGAMKMCQITVEND